MRAAFFDVDGTLASSNVVSCYAHLCLNNMNRASSVAWLLLFLPRVPFYMLADSIDRALFSRRFFGNYRSVMPWQLERWVGEGGEDYWRRHLLPEALACIEQHRQQGDEIVLASGGIEQSLIPLVQIVSPNRVICARLEHKDGRFTGRLASGPIVGKAKADAVRKLASESHIDLAQSYAYGDSYSDREFLECVGHPVAVNPDRALLRLATEQGWQVVDWKGKGKGRPETP